ncbi:MAG: hypothetical protein R3240_00845, partial [Gammaproteobacteria bacterium]|nr:hypothetical protein [Gammaproteobacteria bacterium]
MIKIFKFFLVFALVLLAGCATTKKEEKSAIVKQAMIPTESINIERRKEQAQLLFKEQDFHQALVQWKILLAIEPGNPEYINRIRVLEALIKRRTRLYLIKGKDALENDHLKEAEKNLLMTLALSPNDHFALKMMRQIEARKVTKVQIAKTNKLKKRQLAKYNEEQQRKAKLLNKESMAAQAEIDDEQDDVGEQEKFYLEMGKVLFKKGDWSGAIREINKYLSTNKSNLTIQNMLQKAHLNMADMFEKRGHWEPAIQHLD